MSQNPVPFIKTDFERVSAKLVKKAAKFQAAILADVGGRRGTMGGRIAPLSRKMKVAGPAFTVEVRPGDNLMIHTALALAKPGDVIVVDGKGDQSCALTGALMAATAQKAGFAGFVMDAAVRDADECEHGTFPIFSVGTNPNGPTKGLAGRIGWPISMAGTTVNPGDLIVGDADGVVVIPRETAEHIISLAQAKVDAETKKIAEIKKGQLDAPWLLEALVAAGVLKKGEKL